MKNILLITSLYPTDDIKLKNTTSVCHYFAKDWKSMGYEVRVIFYYNIYPFFYYPFLKLASKILANRFDAAILTKRFSKVYHYEIDGIKVSRIPIYKRFPRGSFGINEINKQVTYLKMILNDENYKPSFILGHFIHPGLDIVSRLKDVYPDAITSVSLHGKLSKYCASEEKDMRKIDYIGFRSYQIGKSFEKVYGKRKCFYCFSGIPNEYLKKNTKVFNKIKNFIYVGNFMKRKYPSSVILGVADAMKNMDFKITFVGDGNGLSLMKKTAKKTNVEKRIFYEGRIPREEVKKKLDNSDVFVMISEKETFGLVYLEAMARGCITIASRNEGMDGIIIDGVNGFLCKAGDYTELADIIRKILSLDRTDIIRISNNAIRTASEMTDSLMAERYLQKLQK